MASEEAPPASGLVAVKVEGYRARLTAANLARLRFFYPTLQIVAIDAPAGADLNCAGDAAPPTQLGNCGCPNP